MRPFAKHLLRFVTLSLVVGGIGGSGGVLVGQELPSPLTFSAARARAVEANPQVRAAAARARAQAAGVAEASTLPDPTLQVGAMNVRLPGLEADMPASMAPALQLTQMIPLAGRLGVRGRVAEARAAAEAALADEAEWMIHAQVAQAFHRLAVLDGQTEVQEETVRLVESFRTVAAARYASGEGRQADVLRADVETGTARAELAQLRARRSAAVARLNAVMDQPADAPIDSVVPAPATSGPAPALEALLAWAEDHRPALAAQSARVDAARQEVDLARRELWPDLMVGVQYGTRADAAGRDHMGGLMLGVSLPVFASRRQIPLREQASAELEAARAELHGMRVEIRASLQEVLAEVERARTLLALYDDDILPTARASVTSALAAYQAGAVDFSALLDAQVALNRFEMDRHALLGDEAIGMALLEAITGRELQEPSGDPLDSSIPDPIPGNHQGAR